MAEVVKCNPAVQALVEKDLNFSKDYQKVIDAVFNYWVSPACNDPRIQSWADFSGADRQAWQMLCMIRVAAKQWGENLLTYH